MVVSLQAPAPHRMRQTLPLVHSLHASGHCGEPGGDGSAGHAATFASGGIGFASGAVGFASGALGSTIASGRVPAASTSPPAETPPVSNEHAPSSSATMATALS